jgi:iron complex transport system ATP-binding protein
MTLEAIDVTWEADGRLIIHRVCLRAERGCVVGLLGPNGSGKSTLLRCLAGLERPSGGRVLLEGRDLAGWRRVDRARRMAVLSQEATTELELTVADVVRLGRIPHRARLAGDAPRDAIVIADALARVDLADLSRRRWQTLSGGERQRVQLARVLAQEPSELLLDEPTNHLDIRHQLAMLALVRELGVTAVIALHDLNLAAAYCDELVVLDAGRVVAAGAPADVVTERLVREVYGVASSIDSDEITGRPYVRFRSDVPAPAPPALAGGRRPPR